MPKYKKTVSITNGEEKNEYKTNAIIDNNIIRYKEKDNTTVKYNYETANLIRDNKELSMNYSFHKNKKTIGIIGIKELNKNLKLEIKTDKIERKDYDIEIIFTVEDNKFIYRIEVEK